MATDPEGKSSKPKRATAIPANLRRWKSRPDKQQSNVLFSERPGVLTGVEIVRICICTILINQALIVRVAIDRDGRSCRVWMAAQSIPAIRRVRSPNLRVMCVQIVVG